MKNRSTQKKKWQKITNTERFSLFQSTTNPTLYEVSWKKSTSYGRRRFNAGSIESALERAPIVAGLEAEKANPDTIRMADAFTTGLETASRGKKSRGDWLYWVERFMKWLAEKYPNSTHWHLLTRQIVREYLTTYEGKSANTKRLALQPIAQTSGFMSREYGFSDIASKLGIGAKLQTTPRKVYLSDVLAFCDYLAEKNPRLEAGVALQGLAGLQLQEATRLTRDRVDLEHSLVEISGEVKNEYRNRVIPVCGRVLEALKRAHRRNRYHSSKTVDVRETVVVRLQGGSYGEWWEAYSKDVAFELKKWNPRIDWKAKDLRNCLPTFAVTHGLLNDVWEQYLGHAPRTITARHYIPRLASASQGEAQALERQTSLFRLQVIEPLEKAIEGKSEAKILNFFERGASNQLINSKS